MVLPLPLDPRVAQVANEPWDTTGSIDAENLGSTEIPGVSDGPLHCWGPSIFSSPSTSTKDAKVTLVTIESRVTLVSKCDIFGSSETKCLTWGLEN